jgi:hypothetical protein
MASPVGTAENKHSVCPFLEGIDDMCGIHLAAACDRNKVFQLFLIAVGVQITPPELTGEAYQFGGEFRHIVLLMQSISY